LKKHSQTNAAHDSKLHKLKEIVHVQQQVANKSKQRFSKLDREEEVATSDAKADINRALKTLNNKVSTSMKQTNVVKKNDNQNKRLKMLMAGIKWGL
jgi:hypothetical protein